MGRSVGQLADLVGDHGKTAASLAGAGGLDCRVERQEIGLVRDFLDQVDNATDLLGTALQTDHLVQGLPRVPREIVQLLADRVYRATALRSQVGSGKALLAA
jgi:hypothetical protein